MDALVGLSPRWMKLQLWFMVFVCYSVVFSKCSLSSSTLKEELGSSSRLRFTNGELGYYNVTFDTNDGLIRCNMKLGMYVYDERVDIGYFFVDPKRGDTFTLHQRKIANFAFFKLTVKAGKNTVRSAIPDLLVGARNRKTNELIDTTRIHFDVRLENAHRPEFQNTSVNATVIETHLIGDEVARVYATDADEGLNGEIYYFIPKEQSSVVREFAIHPSTGVISVINFLDVKRKTTYFFDVQARDRCTKTDAQLFSTRLSVQINVLSVKSGNDVVLPEKKLISGSFSRRIAVRRPFSRDLYIVNMTELAPPSTTIIALRLQLKRGDDLNRCLYGLNGGNEKGQFQINSKTGLVYLNRDLDYEDTKQYRLSVFGSYGGMFVARTTVVVNVLDANDNSPAFPTYLKDVEIDENIPVGGTVASVHATDADSGSNGRLTYAIANVNQTSFDVHPSNGEIFVSRPLDRDTVTPAVTALRVRASDRGSPFRRQTDMFLRVTVRDVNDNPPVLAHDACRVLVAKGTLAGSKLLQATALDLDVTLQNTSYAFASGGRGLAIDSRTGVVTLADNVDAVLAGGPIIASVTASDGQHTSSRVLNVTVTLGALTTPVSSSFATSNCSLSHLYNVEQALQKHRAAFLAKSQPAMTIPARVPISNAYVPVFKSSIRSISLTEDNSVGVAIAKVEATDKDFGCYGLVVYSITSGNNDGLFMIDVENGTIALTKALDYESRKRYSFTVRAWDNGNPRLFSQISFAVNVVDVNDNAPEFNQSTYVVMVTENTRPTQPITAIHAIDKDEGENGRVTYSLVSSSSMFSLDSINGEVRLLTSLDREQHSEHLLEIIATDHAAVKPKSSIARLRVVVVDVNDCKPQCYPLRQSIHIPRYYPVWSVVSRVVAFDNDSDVRGAVQYRLTSAGEKFFAIHEKTGIIQIKNPFLNVDTRFNLTVEVSDGGSPSLSSQCYVSVELYHHGVYASPTISSFVDYAIVTSIPRSIEEETQILVVAATSVDDGKIEFDIVDGSGLGKFLVNPETGMVMPRKNNFLEKESFFWLTIQARIKQQVHIFSNIHAIVYVKHSELQLPYFSPSVYQTSTPENSPVGATIAQLYIVDPNSYNVASNLEFEIVDGNHDGHFEVRNDAFVICNSVLDYELKQVYLLNVSASVISSPELKTYAIVYINVIDENDNLPKLYVAFMNVRALVGANVVGQVLVFDKDSSGRGQMHFELDSPVSDLLVNSSNGIITSSGGLSGTLFLNVIVKDEGTPIHTVELYAQVDSIEKPQSSSTKLKFRRDAFSFRFMEGILSTDSQFIDLRELIDTTVFRNEIFFQIISGNEAGDFSTFPMKSNQLVLLHSLDFELTPNYTLMLQATDGIQSTTCTLKIDVINARETPLVMTSQSCYEASIVENSRNANTDLIQVEGVSKDTKKKSKMSYRIAGGSRTDIEKLFYVEEFTGRLRNYNIQTDRETEDSYVITVAIKTVVESFDYMSGAYCVVLKVDDVNDNAPKFLRSDYDVSVTDTLPPTAPIVTLTATDADSGPNAMLKYSIQSGNDEGVFQIDGRTGIIHFGDVHRSRRLERYHLQVKVSDNGRPSLSALASVKIAVSPGKLLLAYSQKAYNVSVTENSPVDTVIFHEALMAMPDTVYSLMPLSDDSCVAWFHVDAFCGVVTSMKPLDAEVFRVCPFVIKARDSTGEYGSTANVYVHIEDVNDNAPVFTDTSYHGIITEGFSRGSDVLTSDGGVLLITAVDSDAGRNGAVSVEILEDDANRFFQIDDSGLLTTRKVLDRESNAVYEFHVKASDKAVSPLVSYATVTVSVNDVNDRMPAFDAMEYNSMLYLPVHNDTVVAVVTATDGDSVAFANISYTLQSHTREFSLDSYTGVMRVKNAYFLRQEDNVVVVVSASDGIFTARANIKVSLILASNGNFQFTVPVYMAFVEENKQSVGDLLTLNVVGYDVGDCVTFSCLSCDSSFSLDPVHGVISVRPGVMFDREDMPFYLLKVQAVDSSSPPHVSQTVVNVTVQDVNDNPPMFLSEPYYGSVDIDTPKGSSVLNIKATDKDAGKNAVVSYQLLSGAALDLFTIDSKTGVVSTRRDFIKGRTSSEYRFVVQATDMGRPALSRKSLVQLAIVNKDTPIFAKAFNVSIPEDSSPGTVVATTTAQGPMGRPVYYSIMKGDTFNMFAVDFNTGEVSVLHKLDRLLETSYALTVRALDSLTGSWSETSCFVHVTDVNDHAPLFERPSYNITVREDTDVGASLLQVTATDLDQGVNAAVTYSLSSYDHDSSQFFSVDSESGIVRIVRQLDYEKATSRMITLHAKDSGRVPLESSTFVHVHVLDVNDNKPVFRSRRFSFRVEKYETPNQFIGTATASDADWLDTTRLVYTLASSSPVVSIEKETGVLRFSAEPPTHTGRAPLLLNVSCTDGVFAVYADVEITIQSVAIDLRMNDVETLNVKLQENDSPTFLTLVLAGKPLASLEQGTQFVIESDVMSQQFAIDSNSSGIRSLVTIDREVSGDTLVVPIRCFSPRGHYTLFQLNVTILDENDNPPVFEFANYYGTVTRDLPIGATILRVVAHDADAGKNAEVTYTTEGLSENSAMAVNKDSGEVILKSRPQGKLYQFVVKASDNGYPVRETSTRVKISVLQPEEQLVEFRVKDLVVPVKEDMRVGMVLAELSAHVQGGNHPAKNYIISETTAASNGLFVIEKTTGKLRLNARLDFETAQVHRIMVKAGALIEGTLPGFTIVIINVENVNDNPPILDKTLYALSLSEDVKVGSTVLRLVAYDSDVTASTPGTLVYSIANASDHVKSAFHLDPTSAWLTTKTALDREKTSQYDIPFSVSNVDDGRTVWSAPGRVNIEMMDVNDCAPVFSQTIYKFVMREDFLVGQKIGQVYASDADINPEIRYFLAGGTGAALFRIERDTGDIRVASIVDAERATTSVVTAVAYDGIHSSVVSVQIEIQDTNDNGPICQKAYYNMSVSEATPKGSSLFQIEATDVDKRDKLLFLVQGDGVGKFFVNPLTGMLSPTTGMDRETQSRCHFKVVVTDKSGHSCTSDVFLEIADVNDNRPVFKQLKYLATVRENVSLSVVFTRVQAVDLDAGQFGRVYYSLQSSFDGTFRIGRDTGLISVERMLSKAATPSYTLNVIATDGVLSSSVPVNVVVLSKDDRPPRFSQASYIFNVSESADVGDVVGNVVASPSDENRADDIRYVIIIGEDVCTLDRRSGQLTLRRTLDYERNKFATVSVKAEYSFAPSLASIVTVVLHVNDVNDNTPRFGEALITRTIDENLRPSSFVLQALATDNDTGENGRLTYTILMSGKDAATLPFTIKPNTGAIHVDATGTIDREIRSWYLFTVEASDHGMPSRTGTVRVNVTVADLNDNAPTVSITNTTVVLQESSAIGTRVITLSASDADATPNGAPFHFLLLKGDSASFATSPINHTACFLVTKQRLSASSQSESSLVIRVRDNGSPPQFTNCHVRVIVVPDSMFAPELAEPTTFFVLLQNGMHALTIGQLRVRDKDPRDYHTFSIVSGNDDGRFSVDQITGVVRGDVAPGLFTVGVQVSDGRFNDGMVINVVVHNETEEMYDNSVVVSVSGTRPDDFVNDRLSSLGAYLSRVTGTGLENVNIWSVQSRRRQSRSTEPTTTVEVAFAVRKKRSTEGYITPSSLRVMLTENAGELEASVGGTVAVVSTDLCNPSPCPDDERCVNVKRLIDDSPTKSPSILSREFQSTFKCLCTLGSKNPSCPLYNPCDNDPCPVGEVCVRDGSSYQCQCQNEKLCKKVTDAIMLDGSGYVRYQLRDSFDKMFKSFALEFRTEEKKGTLFYAFESDYCILEIVSGRLQFRFDFGSGLGLVSITEVQVNDGDWHAIEVKRNGNYVALSLDGGKYTKDGTGPGNLVKIDLLSNTFYLGTSIVSADDATSRTKRSLRTTYNPFKGCLRKPTLNGDSLPWSGTNTVVHTAEAFSVINKCRDSGMCSRVSCPFFSQCINTLTSSRCQCLAGHEPPYCRPLITCKDAPCLNGGTCTYLMVANTIQYRCQCPASFTGPQCHLPVTPCTLRPCQNGGTCRETGNSYVCSCERRFKGRNCELDTDPCRSKPCFRNARCSNLGLNRFNCDCEQSAYGRRCGYGQYCTRMTCINGGTCIESMEKAECRCPAGYSGERCETDINECLSPDVCSVSSTCINTLGGHFCNCTQPGVCGPTTHGTVAPAGLPMPAIAGAGVAILLLIILIVVVCWHRKRVRRREQFQRRTAGDQPDVKYPFNCYPLNEYQGVPETPPNPPRPQASPRQPPSYYEGVYDSDYAMAETDFYDPSAVGNSGSTLSSSKSECVKSPFSESASSTKDHVEVDEEEKMADEEVCGYATKGQDSEIAAAEGRSLASEYHWDYAEVPDDVRHQSNRKMSREGSYMAIPLTEAAPAPHIPQRTASRRSSMRGNEEATVPPTPPDYPRNIRISRQSLPKSENTSPDALRHRQPRSRVASMSAAHDHNKPLQSCDSDLSLTSYPGVNTDLTRGDFENRYSLTTDGGSKAFQPISGHDDDDYGEEDDAIAGPSRAYYERDQYGVSVNDGCSETTYNSDDDDCYTENDPLDPDDTRKLVRDIKDLMKEMQSKTEEDL